MEKGETFISFLGNTHIQIVSCTKRPQNERPSKGCLFGWLSTVVGSLDRRVVGLRLRGADTDAVADAYTHADEDENRQVTSISCFKDLREGGLSPVGEKTKTNNKTGVAQCVQCGDWCYAGSGSGNFRKEHSDILSESP